MRKIEIAFLTFVFIIGIGINPSFGQTKEEKKQAKEEKKRLKEEAELADWNQAKAFAASKRFVFSSSQAFTIDGSFGTDPKLNFFYVIDDKAVLQFALDGVVIKGNGVGGITWTNDILNYKVIADNTKKPVRVDIALKPIAGQGVGVRNISVTFYSDGYGEVDILGSGIRLNGNIVKPEQSNIFKGTSF